MTPDNPSRRALAQRAHQGGLRLPARHADRGPTQGRHGRDLGRRRPAREVPRHVPAGRPRPRAERTRKKMEKAFSFMIRLRIPGGVVTPKQWLILDDIARTYANGTLRATTRQTFQYHGVIKSNLKRTMRAIDGALLDTIAACGDVNRNVLAATNPHQSGAHQGSLRSRPDGSRTSSCRRRGAWREIWLDGERSWVAPRTSRSTADLPAQEVQGGGGRAALQRGRRVRARPRLRGGSSTRPANVEGWTVTVGGGMGMTHGEPDTFPRLADPLLFCTTKEAVTGGRGRHDGAARLGRPLQPQGGAPEIHDRAARPRGLPGRGREAGRASVPGPASVHVHVQRRPLRLERGRGRPPPPDAVHRERPRPKDVEGRPASAVGPAPHRGDP